MENRKRILIIGAGTFQLPIIKRAAEKYEVLVAAPKIPEEYHRYIDGQCLCDVRDQEAILSYAKEQNIDGVITDQTDIPVRTVAYVAENLGLPGIGYESSILFTNKDLMRRRMEELGIPTLPNEKVYSEDEAVEFFEKISGPVILKPIDNQGSRGLSKCLTEDEVRSGFANADRWSSKGGAVIEKCATGREFVVEGMAFDGRFRNLCIGDTNYFTSMKVFAAMNRIFPTNAPAQLEEKVLDLNKRIIEGFGLKQGITHSEFKMEGDEVYLIETAARGGGVYISSDLISLSTGLDTEEFLLNIALGQQEKMPEVEWQKECCGYSAFFVPFGKILRADGIEEVKALPFVHSNQLDEIKVGTETKGSHTDKTSRLAIIITAPDQKTWYERQAMIREMLKVEVENEEGICGLIWE